MARRGWSCTSSIPRRKLSTVPSASGMGCARRSSNWTSFSLPWEPLDDHHHCPPLNAHLWRPRLALGGCGGVSVFGALLVGLEALDDGGDVGELDALFTALGRAPNDRDDIEVVDGDLDVAVAPARGRRHLDLGAETGVAIAEHAGEEGANGIAESEMKPTPHFAGHEVDGDQLVAPGRPFHGDALGRRV